MLIDRPIPHRLKEKVDRELKSGERIEWIEMPVPRFFVSGATSAFLFGIPWTAFALFWTASAARATSKGGAVAWDAPFPLFGVPFILIGLALLSSPLWAYRKAFRTVYVITNRRAITFEGGWTTAIKSYFPENLRDMSRTEKKDGTGDVIIARRVLQSSNNNPRIEELGFLRVRDPRTTELKLQNLARQTQADISNQPPAGV